MISLLFIQMVKYAFGFPLVAMVSHIPVKSRMAVNYVNSTVTYPCGRVLSKLRHNPFKFAKDFDGEFSISLFLLRRDG